MVDGWDMVQRPAVWHPDASALSLGPGSPHFLPPPPSRPADVHNWERAMFTDRCAALRSLALSALHTSRPRVALMLCCKQRAGSPMLCCRLVHG